MFGPVPASSRPGHLGIGPQACGVLEKPQIMHVKAREATVEELAR